MYFDGHCDVFSDVTIKRLLGENNVIRRDHLKKYKEGKVDVSIFVMWVDPPFTENPAKRFAEIEQSVKNELKESEDIIHKVLTFDDFDKAEKMGKLAIMIGSEGLSHIGSDVSFIDYMYSEIGTRHIGLTWNEENQLATGVRGNPERGLTEFGKEAVGKIQDLGIILDVSHLNEKSFWDVMELAKKPIIASHSNCRAICDNKRNLTDEQIRAIGKNGGVIGVNAFHEFVSTNVKNKTCAGLVDHVDRIVQLVGIDHVGFGFDFTDFVTKESLSYYSDDVDTRIEDFYKISQAQSIITELEKRGYSQDDIEKIRSNNFLRICKIILK